MKRYCQSLSLTPNPELIDKYLDAHRHVWPEVIQGQREVGILSMQIYADGNRLFMIVDTTDTFDWDRDMALLATKPRQAEWEAYVSQFQGCPKDATSKDKWTQIPKIFDSNDNH